jgi:hypothetical protein
MADTPAWPAAVAAAGTSALGTLVVDDPFTTELLSCVADQGTSLAGLAVTDGRLGVTDTADHSFHRSGVTVTDAAHIIKVIPGSISPRLIYLAAKFVDAANYLMAQDNSDDVTGIRVIWSVAGAISGGTPLARPAAPGGEPYWMVLRVMGNAVAFELHIIDPAAGVAPYASSVFLLTGASSAALGAGVAGAPGLRLTSSIVAGAWQLDDWRVKTPPTDRAAF